MTFLSCSQSLHINIRRPERSLTEPRDPFEGIPPLVVELLGRNDNRYSSPPMWRSPRVRPEPGRCTCLNPHFIASRIRLACFEAAGSRINRVRSDDPLCIGWEEFFLLPTRHCLTKKGRGRPAFQGRQGLCAGSTPADATKKNKKEGKEKMKQKFRTRRSLAIRVTPISFTEVEFGEVRLDTEPEIKASPVRGVADGQISFSEREFAAACDDLAWKDPAFCLRHVALLQAVRENRV